MPTSNKRKLNKVHAECMLMASKLADLHSMLLTSGKPNQKCYDVVDSLQEAAYLLGDAMRMIDGKPKVGKDT